MGYRIHKLGFDVPFCVRRLVEKEFREYVRGCNLEVIESFYLKNPVEGRDADRYFFYAYCRMEGGNVDVYLETSRLVPGELFMVLGDMVLVKDITSC